MLKTLSTISFRALEHCYTIRRAHYLECGTIVASFRVSTAGSELQNTSVDAKHFTTGSEISIYYDPMISKVIAHAKTRQEAISRLNAALSSTVVLGFQTNKFFLR